jgi:hypothetical protein
MVEQGKRCGCRGTDDMCPCQNETPWPRETTPDQSQEIARLQMVASVLAEALKPFAEIEPSSLYSDDGSEAEGYVALLRDSTRHLNRADFTGTDLARARQALAAALGADRRGLYVASRASVLARGAMWRDLRAKGAPIISSWIDEDGPNDTADLDELWVRIRREVLSAERLILYVEPDDFPLKGAFVEVGMALAAGVPITIVAPGVEITGRNQRPFGSWIKHPSVSFAPSVQAALGAEGESMPIRLAPMTTKD